MNSPRTLLRPSRLADLHALWVRIHLVEGLKAGWLDGEGWPPSRAAITLARGVLSHMLVQDETVRRPGFFPCPDGSVQAEWDLFPVEIWFASNGAKVRFEAVREDGFGIEETLDVHEQTDVADLARKLLALMREASRIAQGSAPEAATCLAQEQRPR